MANSKNVLSRIAVFLTACFCCGQVAYAQEIDYKGDELYKAHCYEKATIRYLKFFESDASNKANPKLLRRIAESVLRSEMVRDTARYFADLYLTFEPKDMEAQYMSAIAHYHAHDFDIALQRLDTFQMYSTTEEQLERAELLNSWIRNARRMTRDTLRNPLINLGDAINTRNNELNPYIINDDQTLVFSCDDKFDREAIINVYNIKTSDQTALSWGVSKKASGNINTRYDEYPSGVTEEGIFFCTNKLGDFALGEAKYGGNGRFSDITMLKDPIDLRGSEVSGCLSPSGDTLYFSGTTLEGKLDIFYSIRTYNGQWMEARPIPGGVNRDASDENYPYLTNNGTRLYFASDREGTMGGYDLFYSDFDFKKFEWGTPVQLPYPINDTYDNMTISFGSRGRYAYVSLFRPDSYGCRDIYAILFDHIVPTSAIIKYKISLRGPNNKASNLTKDPRIEIRSKDGELVALQRVNMSNFSFLVVLDPGSYVMTIDAPEAEIYTEEIEIPEMEYEPVAVEKTILLKKK